MPQTVSSTNINELSDGRPEGTRLGQSTSDLVAFYGGTPIDQPTSASQAAVTMQTTASVTALRTDVDAIAVLINRLRKDLVSLALVKGS
ncbi:MAG TPA: hypothetical protein VJ957_06555 [Longimicrobiales bacterium]|nr:hypothetical protein [Longimicrobiales bacterium]